VLPLLRCETGDAWLEEIDFVQPALTAVMVALVELWRSWGIEPRATVGFSMGEAAAAYAAGILNIKDTMAVVCRRTRLMKRLQGQGAIATVPLPLAEAEKALLPYCNELSIAVVAAPQSTVISGNPAALKEMVEGLEKRGLACRLVKVGVASHSAQMDSLLEELRQELAGLQPSRGLVPMLSTVYDEYLEGPELNAEYWARNLRYPVLQMNSIARLLQDGCTAFLEISPHPVAWGPLVETIRHLNFDCNVVPSLWRGEGERQALLKGVGSLYGGNILPDWKALFRPEEQHVVSLPPYPWQGKPYWFHAAEKQVAENTAEKRTTGKAPSTPAIENAPQRVRRRLLEQLRNAPAQQRRAVLLDLLQSTAARILKINPKAVRQSAPLRELGLTSLMSTEFALELQKLLGYFCSATLFFNYPTIERIADHLLKQVLKTEDEPGGADEKAAAPGAGRASVERHAETGKADTKDIAVIGLGCRFPGGAGSVDDYWRILRDGVDAIVEVPSERWNIDEFYAADPERPGKMYTRWGGFLDAIDHFDAGYFGISSREAEVLDPQQRLLLEVTVEALEHAGLAPDPEQRRNAGVFIGIMNNNDFASVKGTSADPSRINAHDSTGHATSAAAGRLAYTFGFLGPSLAVDTACSSSLVAIHLACQALRSRECEIALAGGVNVILAPETTISFCKTRMLSPTGCCKTFDASADGYVRGEGCGMIVLKRLPDALRDNDNILAVIKGSAVNQDGRSSSLTAPNGLAQRAVVRQALDCAGIDPRQVDYVEAHGTGTALGDPIEVEALGKVLGEGRDPDRPFLVGSVKTNIGHLEAAAGVAGLIKVILSLHHEEIPPHLNLREVNPRISLSASKAAVPMRLTPWQRGKKRRIAGVSSFGFVGTNAHIVLEEPPQEARSGRGPLPQPGHRLLALSAHSANGLKATAVQYARMMSGSPMDIDDLCYTANTGRIHHAYRAAFTAASTKALLGKLQTFVAGVTTQNMRNSAEPVSSAPKVAFLFTGQGAQYPRMGAQLFAAEPVFREAMEHCSRIMDPLLQRPLLRILMDENPSVLKETRFVQPALFALEYALLQQWRAWGIEPFMVMGHSLGEYGAAVAAGVLSLEEAAKLVVARGLLMQSIQIPGGSAAVFAGEDFVRRFLEPYRQSVAIAADNAPQRVLIAGEAKHLQEVCEALRSKEVEVHRMDGPLAAHSPLMEPILDTFEKVGAMASYAAPRIPMVSTRTARVVTHAEIRDPRHWRDLIRHKVRFREGMQTLYDAGCRIFVEIGPRHTLVRLGEMCLPSPSQFAWLPSLSKEKHDQEQMLESLGELHVRGAQVSWSERHRPFAGRKIPLPTTIFQRKRYWPAPVRRRKSATAEQADAPALAKAGLEALLGRRLRSPLNQIQFEARVDVACLRMLEEHRVLGNLMMPAAAQLVRVLAAMEQCTTQDRMEIREALLAEPMVLSGSDDARIAYLVLTPEDGHYDFRISSVSAENSDSTWHVHVIGHAVPMESVEENLGHALMPENFFIGNFGEEFSAADFYALQAQRGYAIGPSLRWLERVRLHEQEALINLRMPPEFADNPWQGMHPGLLDSCFQAATRVPAVALLPEEEGVLVPSAIKLLRLFGKPTPQTWQGPLYCRISALPQTSSGNRVVTLAITGSSGNTICSIAELHFQRASRFDLPARGAELHPARDGPISAVPINPAIVQKPAGESHLSLLITAAEYSGTGPARASGNGGNAASGKFRELPEEGRRAAILEQVMDLVRSITGMDPSESVGLHARFDALGVDSLLTLDLINALNHLFGITLPATIFIDCPTIELFSGYLSQELARDVAQGIGIS
jgi:acyl transferase domain-containing protein